MLYRTPEALPLISGSWPHKNTTTVRAKNIEKTNTTGVQNCSCFKTPILIRSMTSWLQIEAGGPQLRPQMWFESLFFPTVWTKKSCHAIPTACPVTQVYCQTCLWLIQNNFHKSWNFLFSQFSFLECLNSNKLVPNIQFPPTQTNSPATPETAQGNRIGNLAHDQVKKHCTRWSLQHQIAMVLHGLPITRINGPMVQRNIHGKLVVCGGWWFGIPVQGGGH